MSSDATIKIGMAEETSKVLSLIYPEDLGSVGEDRYIRFEVQKYSKISINQVEKTQTLSNIYLPLPAELATGDVLDYEEYSAEKYEALNQAIISDNLKGAVMGVGAFSASVAKGTLNKLGFDNAANFAQDLSGYSVNPRNSHVFKTPKAREYQYNFDMIATSLEESNRIRRIINRFRYHAYPGADNTESFFQAPDVFRISFNPAEYLYKPLPSVLVAMTVKYNGSSTPVFFRTSNAPVEVSLSLVFREIELDNKIKLMDPDRYPEV